MNYSKDVIKTRDNSNFAFGVRNVVFEQNQFHLSKLPVFYRNKSMGTENNP